MPLSLSSFHGGTPFAIIQIHHVPNRSHAISFMVFSVPSSYTTKLPVANTLWVFDEADRIAGRGDFDKGGKGILDPPLDTTRRMGGMVCGLQLSKY